MRYVLDMASPCSNKQNNKKPKLTLNQQALANGVLITRLKAMPLALGATVKDLTKEWKPQPALKVCVTTGLSKRDVERAGVVVRHAVTAVLKSKKWQR